MLRGNPTILAVLAMSLASLGPLSGMIERAEPRRQHPVADGTTTVVVSDAVRTEWRCIDGQAALWVVGKVTVQNTGDDATDGLRLRGILEYANEPASWTYDVGGLDLVPPPIGPGETFEHSYAFPTGGWRPNAEYRHSVAVLLHNLPEDTRPQAPSTSGRSVERPLDVCPVT
jgi:hypothetical protein